MKMDELIVALDRLKVETGSLACLGCGHEHNCSTHGCAIIHEAAETIEKLVAENRSVRESSISKEAADLLLMQNKKVVAK